MEDRYEIRGKIGEGGLGSVYRAWDRSLKREVAIKRIVTSDDGRQKDEAARQMEQETGALAALQHPHIVTIYDVGTDAEGPFVVMEFIKGETIDQIIERAPLTPRDFREFALQVQEGLIAAQDLGLVHRDLKPSNVMLNWLPSGKFQVKIVDFGLAKFGSLPSLQTVDHSDSIYGSIFFMAPEQFERVPIDTRTDMYAIGCVFYFTLAGVTPFQGDTGPQVMAAHLQHQVTPLGELRPDLPTWICDWVMWHINRQPGERPENAREALQNFMELDQPLTQSMPSDHTQPVPAADAPKRPRLIIPGAAPAPAKPVTGPQPSTEAAASSSTAPQPLQPPTDSPPSLHATDQQAAAPPPEPTPAAAPPKLKVASSPPNTPAPPPVADPVATAPATAQNIEPQSTTIGGSRSKSTKGLSSGAKFAIGSITALLIVVVALLIVDRVNSNKETARFNELIAKTDDPLIEEILVNSRDLEMLLKSTRLGGNQSREAVYKALSMAEPIDGTDVDARIAEFATTEPLHEDIRVALLARVIRKRNDPSVTPLLLDFARQTSDERAAAAAITAITDVGGDEEVIALLDVIRHTGSGEVRKSAESAVASIIRDSANRRKHTDAIVRHYERATDNEVRHTYLRLLGIAGGKQAEETVISALESDKTIDQLAAIQALRAWPDASLFPRLVEFIAAQTDNLRTRAFDAAYAFLTDSSRDLAPADAERLWKSLAAEATTEREQFSIVSGVAQTQTADWAIELAEKYTGDEYSSRIVTRAENAVDHINEQRKLRGKD